MKVHPFSQAAAAPKSARYAAIAALLLKSYRLLARTKAGNVVVLATAIAIAILVLREHGHNVYGRLAPLSLLFDLMKDLFLKGHLA